MLDFSNEETSLSETLFHNANGYIGVRVTREEGVPGDYDTMRGMYINGFYDIIPMKQAENLCNFVEEKETMLNVADTQTIEVYADGERFSHFSGKTLSGKRILNMEDGITERTVIWESETGKKLNIDIKRMTSFHELSLFTIEYAVTAENFSGELEFKSYHKPKVRNYCNPKDPRLAAESHDHLKTIISCIENSISFAVTETEKSRLKCATAVAHEVNKSNARICTTEGEDNIITCDIIVPVKKGETVVVTKYSVFTDSLREKDPLTAGRNKLKRILDNGLNYYYGKQKEYLSRFFERAMMEIDGDEALNKAVNFNMYELLQSSAKDSHGNIAAKGLSGEGYEGHYFWDTEMFMLPFFVLTDPDLARMLLRYRYETLDKARENALLLGHKKGALYPWRTITGVECSGYFPSGTAQYHINGDIAYAIINYYLVTGDLEFINEWGEEILLETARLWLDAGNYVKGRFVLNDVTGPDEYTCMVNNNYYTNMVARHNLLWAARFYHMIKETASGKKLIKKIGIKEAEIKEMEEACKNMYLPYDEETGIIPQDDSFFSKPVWDLKKTPRENFPLLLHYHPLHLYRYQVCKQADTVMAFFLFDDAANKDTMLKSFRYYETITTHDSSLSKCAFSIVAAKLSLKDEAFSYFGNSAKLDLNNMHKNTKDGIHTANMGGCYMAVVYGFAGLKIGESGISINPFLPGKWTGYRFNICYHENNLHIDVKKDSVSVTLLSGSGTGITVCGKEFTLKEKETIEVNTNA